MNMQMTAARVMVVEDERIVALHLSRQLIKLGYQVLPIIASGEKAIRQVRDMHPDVVLMDIHIEGDMDGIETAARIAAEFGTPVIYLTAHSEESTLQRARETKPYGYLLKPFAERELHVTIQMVIERHRGETALRHSEDRLRQAQKMEAIGQLTGGLAHDFNNLLAVIHGNLELLEERVVGDADTAELIRDALAAAMSGAGITRQLLAFSRQQVLAPRAVDIPKLVANLVGMLSRTLGETIEIRQVMAGDLALAEVDPNQLETALLNVALNARDAMPKGGRLTFEGLNIVLDQDYADHNLDVVAGPYVLLAVNDTGSGMTKEVLEKALDPFFTTKPVGQGSGLGLSMIFGFVKQSGGHLRLYSEPGHGTTLKLYLPLATTPAQELAPPDNSVEPRSRAGEVVLVVEDDPQVRRLALRFLAALGYRALAAEDAPAALAILRSDERIDLLLTDVVLPGGVSGPALMDQARSCRATLKRLYMSGYTKDAVLQTGEIGDDASLLMKPFRKTEFAREIRRILDEPATR
jgi:signal transduction histidine kinase